MNWRKLLKKMRTADPCEVFQKSADEQETFSREGDYEASEEARRQTVASARTIYSKHADRGLAFFTKMLDHASSNVRWWAAEVLLTVEPAVALAALRKAMESSDPNERSAAKLTLDEWEAGKHDNTWIMHQSVRGA